MEKNRTITYLGIGCGFVCVVLAVMAYFAGKEFFDWALEEPENVVINVETPVRAALDETMIITVEILNTASEMQELKEIDFYQDYIEGIVIQESEPAFSASNRYTIGPDFEAYMFDKKISPGETLTVKFYGIGVKVGEFYGEIDVCMNSVTVCETHLSRTIIE